MRELLDPALLFPSPDLLETGLGVLSESGDVVDSGVLSDLEDSGLTLDPGL